MEKNIEREILTNWRGLELKTRALNSFLPMPWENIEFETQEICDDKHSVLINIQGDFNFLEIRDWLYKNSLEFKIYKRSLYRQLKDIHIKDIRIYYIAKYIGANFRFTNTEDACLFKLFWH